MGDLESIIAGTYIIVGVPLFELTIIEGVSYLVERAVRLRERSALRNPLTVNDYKFVSEFYSTDDGLEPTPNTEEEKDAICNLGSRTDVLRKTPSCIEMHLKRRYKYVELYNRYRR